MNIPKTPETAEQVRRLYIYGHTTEEISSSCKVSTGYVSGAAAKLKEQLGRKEVNALRELARLFNKLEISASNAFDGARIFSILKKYEIRIDEFPAFLEQVYQKCREENIMPSKLAHQCKALTELQAKSNIPLDDLAEECGRLLEAKQELEEKISVLEDKTNKANADATKALSEKNQTLRSLTEFEQLKHELESQKLGFEDISKLIKILKQAAEKGYNTDKIIKHLEKEKSHEKRVAEFEQQVKQLQAQLDTIQNEMSLKSAKLELVQLKIENFKVKNKENKQTLEILKTLKRKGIDPLLIVTWDKILETSNLKPKIFEEKLQKFSSLVRLINAEYQNLEQLTKERKQLESDIEFLKANKEKLESTIKYANKIIKESIDKNIQHATEQIKNITRTGSNSIRMMESNSVSSIDKISQKTFDQMNENVNKTQDLVAVAMQASEKIGRLEFFIPLYNLSNGSFEASTLYPALVAILDKLSFHVQRVEGNSSLLIDIKHLREGFIKEMQKIGQH